MPASWSYAGWPLSRAQARTASRTRFPSSVVSQHSAMSITSSQRPALWNPSTGPAGPGANEYSSLLR